MDRALLLILPLLPLGVPTVVHAKGAVHGGASYIVDLLRSVDGGRSRGEAAEGRADVFLDLDGTALGLDGVTVHGDVMAIHGPDFSGARANTYQVLSNIEAGNHVHLYEAWTEWQATPGLAVKAGLVDLNTEFDVTETATPFLNSAHGIGPEFSQSGLNGPSIFPRTATALIVRGTSGRKHLRLGLFDAVAGSRDNPLRTVFRLPGTSGALLVGEIELPLGKRAQVQFGGWHYTTRFDALTADRPPAPASGGYVTVEGPLGAGLSGWVRFGLADGRANPITSYLGAGLTTQLAGWTLGAALARAGLGDRARAAAAPDATLHASETVIEITAGRPLHPSVLIQPDVQYVIHPGWDPAVRNALVAGLRIKVSWPTP